MPIKDVNFAYMKNIIFLQSYRCRVVAGGARWQGRGLEFLQKGSKKPHR